MSCSNSEGGCVWLDTRQQLAKIDLAASVRFSATPHDLIIISRPGASLCTAHHQLICRDYYYQLRQLIIASRPVATNPTTILPLLILALNTVLHCTLASHLGGWGAGPARHWSCLKVQSRHRFYAQDVWHWLPIPQRSLHPVFCFGVTMTRKRRPFCIIFTRALSLYSGQAGTSCSPPFHTGWTNWTCSSCSDCHYTAKCCSPYGMKWHPDNIALYVCVSQQPQNQPFQPGAKL